MALLTIMAQGLGEKPVGETPHGFKGPDFYATPKMDLNLRGTGIETVNNSG